MFFNSIDFAVFLPIVFGLYWLIPSKKVRLQNTLILGASYLFYGWWDWRFLLLIFASTVLDFTIGLALERTKKPSLRKKLVGLSLLVNLGMLAYFKYFNFFLDSLSTAFTFLGFPITIGGLDIVLPVGISFYTFQTLSYTIDVYREKIKATKDFIAFSSFVSFFPQLVAGPIERATHLLPQFEKTRTFDYQLAASGARQILWGLFKKIVVADTCALLANQVFANPEDMNGSTLLFGAIAFTFQIYGDFSGYSDIAIGTARLFGFDLMQNFAFPYFSRDIAEFWRRWHVSLSTWFRDYLYIPLGGSRGNQLKKVRNTFIVFLVSGLWHGASWTFVFWGFLNALYFLPLLLTNKNRTYLDVVAQKTSLPTLKEFGSILLTFSLTTIAWIFFRAESLGQAFSYLNGMVSPSLFDKSKLFSEKQVINTITMILFFLLMEWIGRKGKFGIEWVGDLQTPVKRWCIYLSLLLIIFFFGEYGQSVEFIYFQF